MGTSCKEGPICPRLWPWGANLGSVTRPPSSGSSESGPFPFDDEEFHVRRYVTLLRETPSLWIRVECGKWGFASQT